MRTSFFVAWWFRVRLQKFVSSYIVVTPKRIHGPDLCNCNLKSCFVLAEGCGRWSMVLVFGCVPGTLASPSM